MSIQCLTGYAEHEADCVSTGDSASTEDTYTTTPMKVVGQVFQQPNEEELHTSFEQAISDRVIAVNRQLNLKSSQVLAARRLQITTEPLMSYETTADIVLPVRSGGMDGSRYTFSAWIVDGWQRRIILGSFVLILLMAGFDLLGLLILHAL